MTLLINDTDPYVSYVATAGQKAFAVPFEFFANSDLVVTRAGVTLALSDTPSNNNQFSATGANTEGGGTVTIGGIGAALGEKVVIYRDMPLERRSNFPETGPFPVRSLNTELARHVAMIQQTKGQTNIAVQVAETAATNAATSATNAASSATAAAGSATTASTAATNAGNSATAAATSATNAGNSATAAAGSATSASNSASTASTQAGNASTSATNAANSATAAAASAAAALAVPPASFTTITAAHTASSFAFLALDTSGGAFTVTLPSSGGTVTLRDPTGDWETNPPTVNGNGRTIDGASTLLLDLAGYEVTFTSVGSVWRYSLKYLYGG